jgi:hypothetical protein
LVELGGGEWGPVAQCRPVASLRSLSPTAVLSGHVGERERGQGEVGAGFHCMLGSGWCCSGGAGLRLGVIDSRGRREKKWRRSPLDLLDLLPFFVSKCYMTRTRAGV